MIGIIGIIAFLTVLFLSLIITRIATIALSHTGLAPDVARFQARSAFTGTGFTTGEAEKIATHPVRRKIVMALMVARSAGLITIIISLILSFATQNDISRLMRLGWVAAGSVLLWLAGRSQWAHRAIRSLVHWAMNRWTELDITDYAGLLNISGPYKVTEIRVKPGDWLAGKKLADCRLPAEGVTVLGIHRKDHTYVGVPTKDTRIYPEDRVILYGRSKTIQDLHRRRDNPEGNRSHRKAVEKQERISERQQRQEQSHERTHSATT